MIENMNIMTSNTTTTTTHHHDYEHQHHHQSYRPPTSPVASSSTSTAAPRNSSSSSMISEHDVLLGRGGQTNNHIGNREYRRIVSEHQSVYLHARKKDKTMIAQRIVQIVHNNGGRFLKKSGASDDAPWIEVPRTKAISKTSQALREGLDVRNMTIRPNKIFRCRADDEDTIRKTVGKVAPGTMSMKTAEYHRLRHPTTSIHHHHRNHITTTVSPHSSFSVVSVDVGDNHSLPDLHDETGATASTTTAALTTFMPHLRYQPDLSKSAVDDFCEV